MNIEIKGAKVHNLKNIDITIPRNKITALVGVSGSGKSSIAYDVVYSEGQRQFLESISTYAVKSLKRTSRPDIDSIKGLSPTISIDQKKLRGNPRSTVGTSTEIYTYLRLLFSRFGSQEGLSAGDFSFNNPKGACEKCKGLGVEYDISPNSILDFEKSLNGEASKLNNYKPGARLFNIIKQSKKLDLDKKIKDYSKDEIDFLLYSPRVVLSNEDQGFVQTFSHEGIINRLIKRASDLRGISENKKNSEEKYWEKKICEYCKGGRLNEKALSSKINNKNIGELSNLHLSELKGEISKIEILEAKELLDRILENISYLIDVNLDYLSLNRGLDTLSGGEAQRLKLARELGNNLVEMIYVFDEPTSSLHPKNKENLIKIIKKLKENNNTVLVVEHDGLMIKEADHIIEIGPGAGRMGGDITIEGKLNEIIDNSKFITGEFLKENNKKIKENIRKSTESIEIKSAKTNNLKNIDVSIPLRVLCSVIGVSGSGKSSLIIDEFAKKYNDKVIVVNQNPIMGTNKGNIATYTKSFDVIRDVFAKENGINKSLFSFNGQGACSDCGGSGMRIIEMHFMGDVKLKCETCGGTRYKEEILEYEYKEKNINEVLNMTVRQALKFFNDNKEIKNKLQILEEVGLGYINLGQSHGTLSGGEAQRLKLASQLHKKGEIYILDEPTSGLHFSDIEKLLKLFDRLVDLGNTVIVIEHNQDIIRNSDWIIELGPEGGDRGGHLVKEGIPEKEE